eukprot:Skav223983  [mRNA]  locus=scaffold1107:401409:402191:- [translate_table: standard]
MSLGVCLRCHLYTGNPCSCCRTLGRIKSLLEGGNLLRAQEASVLSALRSAAGALSDLVEEAAPVLQAERTTSGFPIPVKKEAEESVPAGTGEEASSSAKKKDEEEDEKESGSKEAVKSKKRSKGGPSEKKSGGDKVKKEKRKKEKKEKVVITPAKKAETEEEEEEIEEESGSTRSEVSQPEELGLKPIPRGSAARHFNPRRDDEGSRGSHRPPEPAGPPPGRFHQDASYWKRKDRSRSKTRRGTKGAQHRERGRDPRWNT